MASPLSAATRVIAGPKAATAIRASGAGNRSLNPRVPTSSPAKSERCPARIGRTAFKVSRIRFAGLPHSLATPIGDDGFGLSAGQRARLALARATLSTAPVLLLDEPTAHLDDVASGVVHDLVSTMAERRTVIVVTHRPELVARADRHVHLDARGAEVRA